MEVYKKNNRLMQANILVNGIKLMTFDHILNLKKRIVTATRDISHIKSLKFRHRFFKSQTH